MSNTLLSLKEALQRPFAPEAIQFLPKDIHQEHGQLVCLALPYANKRVYEDRLNEVAFGEWSTPYTAPYAQDNKLIIPATVVILGVAHTDYGEAFLSTQNKNGTTREDENTATEAYSQAFRRACAKFLLGRYLYDLPKLTLPYDPKSKQIAVSKAERIAWVEKMYLERGLIKPRGASQQPVPSAATAKTSPVQPQAPVQSATPMTTSASQQNAASVSSAIQSTRPIAYPNDTFLDWVCRCVNRDPRRIEDICTTYKVAELAHLSAKQREKLTERLQRQMTTSASSATLQAKR